MLDRVLLNLAIGVILRIVARVEDSIDWEKTKAEAEALVRDLIPGDLLDDDAAAVVHLVIDKVHAVLESTDTLGKVVEALAVGDLKKAVELLKDLLLSAVGVEVAGLDAAAKDAALLKVLRGA